MALLCPPPRFGNALGFEAASGGTLKGSEGAGHPLGARLPHGDPQDPHRISLLRGLVCDQGATSGRRGVSRGSCDPGLAAAEPRSSAAALAPPAATAARRALPGLH